MKMLLASFAACLVSWQATGQTTTVDSSASATEHELLRMAQELFDAIPSGNKAVWQRYVADDALYTDEN